MRKSLCFLKVRLYISTEKSLSQPNILRLQNKPRFAIGRLTLLAFSSGQWCGVWQCPSWWCSTPTAWSSSPSGVVGTFYRSEGKIRAFLYRFDEGKFWFKGKSDEGKFTVFYRSDKGKFWVFLQIWQCRSDNARTVISPSWITEQISVGKCAHRGALVRQERQTSFKIVTWTKQTGTKHHNKDREFYW